MVAHRFRGDYITRPIAAKGLFGHLQRRRVDLKKKNQRSAPVSARSDKSLSRRFLELEINSSNSAVSGAPLVEE